MFDFLKKKVVAPDDVLVAPIKGMAVPSSSINDPTLVRKCWEKEWQLSLVKENYIPQ